MVNWKVRPVVDSRAVTTPDRTSTPVTRLQDGAWARVGALPAPAARQQPTRIATLIRATRLTAIRFMDLVPVDDPNLVRVLKPGQAVGADFQTGVAWVPPGATRYRIVSAGPAPSPGTMGGGLKPPVGAAAPTTRSPSGPAPCASPTTTSAALLKIDGIEGESQDVCHKAEIELLSVQIAGTGASPAGAAGTGVTITKRIDKATPRLSRRDSICPAPRSRSSRHRAASRRSSATPSPT